MARVRGRGERDVAEAAPPQNDAYTGLLVVSLLATLTGLIFVAMDYSDYSAKAPQPKTPASISQTVESQPEVSPPAPKASAPP